MATTSCPAPARAHLTLVPSPAPKATTDVPAVIAGSVNLLRFTEALARAGLVGRHDADRGVLVIEPAQEEALKLAQIAPLSATEDARAGMRWYNGLSHCERAHWHEVARSAVPADCWRAFQAGVPGPL